MPLFNPFREVEGYAQAVYSERLLRDAAFISGPTFICGVEILPMTAEKLLILDAFDCPFLFDEKKVTVWPEQVIQTLWVLSPKFNHARTRWQRLKRWWFIYSNRKINYFDACKALFKFKEETFYDAPKGGGEGKSYFSWLASIVDLLASEYGWSREKITREIPLPEIFQLMRCIRSRKTDKPLSNASEVKIAEHLKKLNANLPKCEGRRVLIGKKLFIRK